MRQTGPRNSQRRHRVLRAAAMLLGIGLVVAAGQVRAQDDVDEEEENQKPFERSIIDNVMSSIGGRRIEDGTINYRERSPLVIPSKTDVLPPPASRKTQLAPNWPKDPDEAERKRLIEEAKKPAISPEQSRMPLMPSELAGKTPKKRKEDTTAASSSNNPSTSSYMLSPSQLGYNGGLFSGAFGGNKEETAVFTGEPERSDLTEPPKGYQTPSPNFAYGTGPSKGKELVCDSASGQCEKRDIK
ncbi:MAG: hypothetical protein HY242_15850 [Afipia sp.]|nr:hypothetical protein [Afipia sp.]